MVDKTKIILMSKMALYEKKHMRRDQRVTNYFIEDYMYINNFKTRLGITLITLFFIGIGAFRIVVKEIIFPNSLMDFFNVYVRPYALPWLITTVVYTIISSIVFAIRYKKANKRLEAYEKLESELKAYEVQHSNYEGAADEI